MRKYALLTLLALEALWLGCIQPVQPQAQEQGSIPDLEATVALMVATQVSQFLVTPTPIAAPTEPSPTATLSPTLGPSATSTPISADTAIDVVMLSLNIEGFEPGPPLSATAGCCGVLQPQLVITNRTAKDIISVDGYLSLNRIDGTPYKVIRVRYDAGPGSTIGAGQSIVKSDIQLDANRFDEWAVRLMHTPPDELSLNFVLLQVAFLDGTVLLPNAPIPQVEVGPSRLILVKDHECKIPTGGLNASFEASVFNLTAQPLNLLITVTWLDESGQTIRIVKSSVNEIEHGQLVSFSLPAQADPQYASCSHEFDDASGVAVVTDYLTP